jgi:lysine decarboxylase
MSTESVIVAAMGAGAAPAVERALAAVHALPDRDASTSQPIALPEPGPPVISLRDACFAPAQLVPVERAVGRVSLHSLAGYPAGTPKTSPESSSVEP